MKVLVVYFSQTGNTEKIAAAICDEASQANVAVLKKLDEADPGSLHEYDQVFIGSPIHAGRIANEVKSFLDNIPKSTVVKLAGFITHAAPAYPKQTIEQMAMPFVAACKDAEMNYQGCFDCQGYLADFMHEAVQKMQNVSDEEWKEKVVQMRGRPNADDEANARRFVAAVLAV